LQANRKTLTKFCSTGRTIFTSSLKVKKSSEKISLICRLSSHKINGNNESRREKEYSTHLSSIGAIMLSLSQSIQKILNGNTSQAIIEYCMHFWFRWKLPISKIIRIECRNPWLASYTIRNFLIHLLWYCTKSQIWMIHHRY